MKLNLHIIKKELSWLSPYGELKVSPTDYPLEYPLYYFPGSVMRSDVLYIVKEEDLPYADGRSISVLCIGAPPKVKLPLELDVLYFEQKMEPIHLLGQVVQIFHKYQSLEQDLHDLALAGGDFVEYGKRVQPFITNPFSFETANFRKVFHFPGIAPEQITEKYQSYLDNVYYDDSAYTTPEETSFLMNDQEFQKAKTYTEPMIYSGVHFGFRTLYYNIRFRGIYVARITIDEIIQPLEPYDFAMIKLFGDLLSLGVRSQTEEEYIQSQEMAAVLQGLLTHRYLPEQQILSALESYKWDVNDSYFCMTVQMKESNQGVVYSLSQQLGLVAPQLCYTTLPGEAVFVIHMGNQKQDQEHIFSKMIPVLRDFLLPAGVSTVFRDFKDLYYHYQMTRFAMQNGQKNHPTFWYFRVENDLLDYFLNRCCNGFPVRTLYHPSIRRLIDHDVKRNTHYTRLLKTYLECNQSIVETIRAEYIHRTTFLYQLDRIKDILKMDLDDPDVCLMLRLNLKLWERENEQV